MRRLILPDRTLFVPGPRRPWIPPSPRIERVETSPVIVETPGILVSIGGHVTIRERPFARVIGHPDLPDGIRWRAGDTLYVSFREAIERERAGITVELHWEPTAEDDQALAPFRSSMKKYKATDPLSRLDGWNRSQ